MKKQTTDTRKYLKTDKGLIFKIYIYQEIIQLIAANNQIENWAKDLNRHFSKENMQMDNKSMKGCSTLLIMKGLQIKVMTRYHFTPARITITGRTRDNKWTLCTVGGTIYTLVEPLWKSIWKFLKKLKI